MPERERNRRAGIHEENVMRRNLRLLLAAGLLLAAAPLAGLAGAGTAAAAPISGPTALSGSAAAQFQLPADVVPVWTARYSDGTVQTRYQQNVGTANVLGGQLTVISKGGTTTAVIGAHYPGLTAKNTRALTAGQAKSVAAKRIGISGKWSTSLMIDPSDARLFYRVENRRSGERWIHWIDAGNGNIRKAYDGIAYDGPGIGVKGDTKTLDTSVQGGTNVMVSSDGRQATYDAENTRNFADRPGILFADADDVWDLAGRTSPGQPAGVDAHYYANVTDDYYQATFGRNSLDDNGMQMVSSAHFARNYNNAFWDGAQMTYGDGDRRNFIEFSGGLDVVGHEFTHGVTEFTSNLIYANESGALNESFSDIIGSSIEFYAAAHGLDPTVSPDFLIGEDISVFADTEPGIRNMTDPREDADPDHYSEFIVTTADNGGVHSNSGIPNHAYYLLVNGGQNAGCDNVGSDGHTHTLDCDVVVDGVGVNVAEQIFYLGFTSLQEFSNMCDARNSTVAVAPGRYRSDVVDAWDAVGIHEGCTPAPPPPPCGDSAATIPFESDHPYTNNLDCTWTYDNGSPGYALHFSLLDVEESFDFVTVTDGNGAVVAQYTGTFRRGVTTPCISTNVSNVRLETDGSVVGDGFIVDAAVPC
jgi:Zn-dependent metalloprotease